MDKTQIKELCIKKEKELLDKYFGNIVNEAAHEQPESIEGYDKELPLRIECEYKEFLRTLWEEITPNDPRSLEDILDEQKLRQLMTDDDREAIDNAYNDAAEQTVWERITHTNHKDVTYYKGLLEEYTRELLLCTRCDFLDEATGEEITGQAF